MSISAFKGSEVAKARSRVATASRLGASGDIADARRDLAAAKLEQYIEKVVSTAPPLTSAQKSRLSALIGGGH